MNTSSVSTNLYLETIHQQKIIYSFPYWQNKSLEVFYMQANNEKVYALAYS